MFSILLHPDNKIRPAVLIPLESHNPNIIFTVQLPLEFRNPLVLVCIYKKRVFNLLVWYSTVVLLNEYTLSVSFALGVATVNTYNKFIRNICCV